MTVTISTVTASNPAALSDSATQLRGKVEQLDMQISRQRQILTDLGDDWKGAAADAAIAGGNRNLERLEGLRSRLENIQIALKSGEANLTPLRTEILNIAKQAMSLGATVSDDGTVTASSSSKLMTPTLAAAYTSTLKSLLQQFGSVDEALASAVRMSASGNGDPIAGDLGDLPASPLKRDLESLKPPDGATDTEVNQWWDSLSDEERNRLIVERPEWVGNLDGVPGTARDLANRNRLGTLRNDPNLTAEERATLTEIDKALSEPDRQLLVVDFDGEHPKVALAIGNVDTADHVSVYVPGTGSITYDNPTDGNDLPAYIEQSTWLKTETERVLRDAKKADETVATVAWLGYEPPSNVVQATRPHYADDNAPALASFINGIDSSRDTDPHLTVLGHSYGSTLASEALQRGTAADDVVFMGSPGLETNPQQYRIDTTPSDLHLSEGHVYVEHSKGDWVANARIFGQTIPSDLPGFTDLSTNAEITPLGPRDESTGHSKYSFADTTALYNQAVVVANLGQDEHYVQAED
ncbi:alpha/beta hydrolase [Mycolicibacterium sp. HK-90]|uniref:alpha/beta hydrolase n=1 Tax=Mycolicibacterium sp. HK-90 TaxID=3056937 RepID=UPI0026588A3C|nr:alpha/beta hydrolase [Mycolicibacterium sp. HK-90]WKG02329.1 alpha/beta hydrolase [Mycolicibacterium sp. HK-90]